MDKNLRWILLFTLVAVVLLALTRLVWVLRPLLVLAAAALLGWLIYQAVNYFLERDRQRSRKGTLEGEIEARLAYCRGELKNNRRSMQEIRRSIREIEEMDPEQKLGEKNRTEKNRLLAGFQREMDLRRAKMEFFQRAIQKLDHLLHNRQVARKLEEKKAELEALRENHYEELAELEEIKTQTELDVLHLRTIEELSSRMLSSESADEALRIQRELETLTADMKRL